MTSKLCWVSGRVQGVYYRGTTVTRARELGISRPLLHLHLQKLEEAGLVTSRLELSSDGKALNYFDVAKFDFALTPASVATAAQSLTEPK